MERGKWLFIGLIVGLLVAFVESPAAAVTVNVVGSDGAPVGDFYWLLEEDATFEVTPGAPQSPTLAVMFHTSYMPVAAKGEGTNNAEITLPDPLKRYFVSVLPKTVGSYSIGGAPIKVGDTSVDVYVNKLPLPTAQITVFVFEDTQPINNAPDLPGEQGLGGFSILVEDAGGRYGASAGAQSLDAFGNFLGTVYEQTCDETGQNPGAGSYGCLDADGSPICVPDTTTADPDDCVVEPLVTGECPGPDCGQLTIKNLAPGKYGIQAVPPAGEGWIQTSTIEGTKVIDAWVKAKEPPFFGEFGPPGYHAFIGFVRPMNDATVLSGGSTISGQIRNLHLSRPPETAFYSGGPIAHTTPWVGLNDLALGIGRGVYAAPTTGDGNFAIHNVPPGNYQLVVWDSALDIIFAFYGVTVNPDGSCSTPGGNCNLGDVPVFQWFTRLENWVFDDDNGDLIPDTTDENGFWDWEIGEGIIPEQAILLRWRDGTIYQEFPTDGEGFVPFDQVFPFFSWLVAEVDFARFKATGVTVTVDDGGPIPFGDYWSFGDQLNPQPQPDNSDLPYRIETGPVLTQAFQGFLGQTSVLQWGKKAYDPGENGGISGIVYYAVTRAEDDPALAAAEPWEPGIPRVTVNLYDSTGETLLNTATTDSWDDDLPTGCVGDPFVLHPGTSLEFVTDCYDGLRNFNQVRPGVFDGGYAFDAYCADVGGIAPDGSCTTMVDGLPSGEYIVEIIPPTGYEIVKEEDRNVDFGDNYIPSPLSAAVAAAPLLLVPECVGALHPVPTDFSLFPLPDTQPYRAGEMTPLCDRKRVFLSNGQNAAADFFLFTEVPPAGHIFGFILDDTANEFDPNSPQFGEKFAPPWLPVSIRDWTGREIARTYSDQYGRYNALVPSTYTTNLPAPSGMSPNMLTTCMNDPKLPDGSDDPHFNPQYSTFCYNFQYMPGVTTYLDTPVLPVAAFAGPDQFPLDCEFADGTPVIKSVSAPTNGVGGGPYVPAPGMQIEITALADTTGTCGPNLVSVPNPEYDGIGGVEPKNICRDYGFGGTAGSVTIGGVPLTNVTWSNLSITGTVAAGTTTGELVVSRSNSKSSITGVTVQVGLRQGSSVQTVSSGGSIQAAIDNAGTNDLILVGPGLYEEMVIMWKPVQLQGWGAGSTIISAVNKPFEKLQAWRDKVRMLYDDGDGSFDLLPGQEAAFGGIEPATLATEEGAGVIVLAKATGNSRFARQRNRGARIDGFNIIGAATGGGIVVNGYADYLDIGNNRIETNSGNFGGGIRLGHPQLTVEQGNNVEYTDADNDNIDIYHNHITQNGGFDGAGGGVSLCTGSDDYQVSRNYICGNFTLGDGGGIGHLGLSEDGLIANNMIIFNENFNQGQSVSGGGIFIGGAPPLALDALTPGSGSVRVIGNLLQGNSAGAGDGGGIRTASVNGQDVEDNKNNPDKWYAVDILNNMIVNNVAALAGAGISMQDTDRIRIVHNTIVNNDSTATAAEAFSPGSPNMSNPQPAGIVSRAHSAGLTGASNNVGSFSNPMLVDNIIRENRSFYFFGDPLADPPLYKLLPDLDAGEPPVFDDLAVLGTAVPEFLDPDYCLLTSLTDARGGDYDDGTNITGDPMFGFPYFNGGRGATVLPGEPTTAIQVPIAFDEGGNFIRVSFGPLTLGASDYRIQAGSDAIDAGTDLTGTISELSTDIEGQSRPSGPEVDIGADELQQ